MTTIEERTSVLRALAEGAISVEEAEDRLASLDGGASRIDGRRPGRRTVDEVIALAANGVEAEFLDALRDAGFAHLDTAEIIRLADHGVEADWLADLPAAVLAELGVEQLIALADNGVEPDDVRAFLDLAASRAQA